MCICCILIIICVINFNGKVFADYMNITKNTWNFSSSKRYYLWYVFVLPCHACVWVSILKWVLPATVVKVTRFECALYLYKINTKPLWSLELLGFFTQQWKEMYVDIISRRKFLTHPCNRFHKMCADMYFALTVCEDVVQ